MKFHTHFYYNYQCFYYECFVTIHYTLAHSPLVPREDAADQHEGCSKNSEMDL